MRIISQNLHAFKEENYFEKFDRLVDYIIDRDIDVVCLQEVVQTTEASYYDEVSGIKKDNTGLYILEKLKQKGYDASLYWSFAHIGFVTLDEGVAIISRLPIQSATEYLVSKSDDPQTIKRRTAIGIKLENGVNIISLHFGIKEGDVLESPAYDEFSQLASMIDDEKALVFGDYNTPDVTENYQKMLALGYTDMFQGVVVGDETFATTPGKIGGWAEATRKQRIDYGMTNITDLKVNECEVVFNGVKQEPISDHYGLYFDIEL